MSKSLVYTIYKTTNLITGKIYIGKHQTRNPNDSYFGSGSALLTSIKKYGKSNFKKEILFIFETEQEMNDKEKELITEEFVSRSDTYNLGIGGEGGPHFKNRQHTEETKRRIGEISSKRKHSEETRKKLSEAGKRRIWTEATKSKIRETKRNRRILKFFSYECSWCHSSYSTRTHKKTEVQFCCLSCKGKYDANKRYCGDKPW